MDASLPHPGAFADRLLAWFEANGRDLPWRGSEDPYHVLICEVLLRRSRGTTVARVTDEFFRRWPTPAALSGAEVDDVAAVIRPLGLVSRARQLVALGHELVELQAFPESVAALCELPGVGRYVAAATLGAPAVDGTSARVYRRYFGQLDSEQHKTVDEELWNLVHRVLPADAVTVRRLNWAVLDLAATVCSPGRPRCSVCPLSASCSWSAAASHTVTGARRGRRDSSSRPAARAIL
jgi:A/G-specific adenine glycosylase